ncbi:class I SAM-dependent methyltransferase [Sphingomonas sp. BIUV-7]|uniref:Class I SAM-dependent methyltransferase n=1 Tax=Sphingomonas natans TaxID=3063330 RepID=A0ABT8YCT9_9SPHN|nr:class I SAM-dependent methyltransferase [Sphingomonas sp. BIUV-7]MDO6416176.1 class I SAM-dependent methyltransferase [Sphingomonas sp. BIUV-7]
MATTDIFAPPRPQPLSERLASCRSCASDDLERVLDLGMQPIANALVEVDDVDSREARFPLELMVCRSCSLCQVSETIPPTSLFGNDYPYFSSFIPALLEHSRAHVEALIAERKLGPDDLIVEVASNDGYLLQAFRDADIPILGIDPAKGPADASAARGIPTLNAFFDAALAEQLTADGTRASVMIANNVLAHVSSINDFVSGFSILLADDGIAEFEFPYIVELLKRNAFDTIYHEHIFYYSLQALEPLFARHGLHLNDATPLEIHGGSLRIRVSHQPGQSMQLITLMNLEKTLRLNSLEPYIDFADRVNAIRDDLRSMLTDIVEGGGTIAAYGAAAKGATLLNFVDLPSGIIKYVVDRNIHKVGKYMPGLMLPIRNVAEFEHSPTTHLLILPWNFADEIISQQCAFAKAGGKFLVAIPKPQVVDVHFGR